MGTRSAHAFLDCENYRFGLLLLRMTDRKMRMGKPAYTISDYKQSYFVHMHPFQKSLRVAISFEHD
jgi:hypothetical protein